MKFLRLFSIIILLLVLVSCKDNHEPIADHADYDQYLNRPINKALEDCNLEMSFWNDRLKQNTDDEVSTIKLASLYASRFQLQGKVEDLRISDSLYLSVLFTMPFGSSEIHQALAANCITQHEFKQARANIDEALTIGDSKDGSLYMLTDVSLELGDYDMAKHTLKKFVNKTSFAFLIRQSKIKDQEGDLDSAIIFMERAYGRIKESKSISIWAQSNLADMYGHAGRVDQAYQLYLEVLKKDPDYHHALKGIAWINFSHDHNSTEAKRILNFLQSRNELPDVHLLLAEVADFENDLQEKTKQLNLFAEKARQAKYHNMYNKYLSILEAEDLANPAQAIKIAQEEILNRPTPQSYDLLVWGYFHQGEVEKALEVAQQHVEGETFEPEALYHLGVIYKNIDEDKSQEFLSIASESSFELGPAIATDIQRHLNN